MSVTHDTGGSGLLIMLDTNALYKDGDGDDFFAPSIERVIVDPKYSSLNIHWSIPTMVRLEREQHLRKKVGPILSKMDAMPAIFGPAGLGNSDTVNTAISNHARSEMNRLNVVERDCDPARVDWGALMRSAAFQLPPFEPVEKNEKGFKDAIIAETFIQLCLDVPIPAWGKTWAFLVTNDNVLRTHIESKIGRSNIRVLADAGALASELNFLISDIAPEDASKVLELADKLLLEQPEFWQSVFDLTSDTIAKFYQPVPGISDVVRHQPTRGHMVFLGKQLRKVHFSFVLTVSRSGKIWIPDLVPQPPGLFGLGSHLFGAQTVPNLGPPGAGHGMGGLLSVVGGESLNIPPTGSFPPGIYPPVPPAPPPPLPGAQNAALQSGRFEEVQLPPVHFDVVWSADFELKDNSGAKSPSIERPVITSISPL